jgi:hypothetical protein
MAAKMLVRYRTKMLKRPEEIQDVSFFTCRTKPASFFPRGLSLSNLGDRLGAAHGTQGPF